MSNYSIREIIEQAIQTEKMGYTFYTSMADRFKDNIKVKELFDLLAGEELKHEKTFTELEGRLADEQLENWDEASQYMKAIVESEFFLGSKKTLPATADFKDAREVVQYAMSFEKDTLLYFQGLKESVKDSDFIKEIINEEKSHILKLHELKNSL